MFGTRCQCISTTAHLYPTCGLLLRSCKRDSVGAMSALGIEMYKASASFLQLMRFCWKMSIMKKILNVGRTRWWSLMSINECSVGPCSKGVQCFRHAAPEARPAWDEVWPVYLLASFFPFLLSLKLVFQQKTYVNQIKRRIFSASQGILKRKPIIPGSIQCCKN